jgi:hypothetical protein
MNWNGGQTSNSYKIAAIKVQYILHIIVFYDIRNIRNVCANRHNTDIF